MASRAGKNSQRQCAGERSCLCRGEKSRTARRTENRTESDFTVDSPSSRSMYERGQEHENALIRKKGMHDNAKNAGIKKGDPSILASGLICSIEEAPRSRKVSLRMDRNGNKRCTEGGSRVRIKPDEAAYPASREATAERGVEEEE